MPPSLFQYSGKFAPLVAMLVLSACALGKDYKQPDLGIDPEWSALKETSAVSTKSQDDEKEPWWKQFNDSKLSGLIEKALANNNDLKLAEARIDEARATERNASAQLFPEFDATGSYQRQRYSAANTGRLDHLSQAGIGGNWTLDLFGFQRRRDEAAEASAEASEYTRDQTRLSLVADVARYYIQVRSLQQQLLLTQKNLTIQQGTVKATHAQRKEGAVSDLEVARAEAQAGNTQSRLPQIKTAIFAALNRLAVLTTVKVNILQAELNEPAPLPSAPEKQVILTPLSVISTRPDVHAAERQLKAATALSDAAFADFFPKITLSALLGPQQSALFGNSTPWSAGVNGVLPILDFGRLQTQLDAANARQQQAFFTYQQTALLAVEEIENALMAYENEIHRSQLLAKVARQQAKAALVAREQYKLGVITQLELLLAENSQLDAENELNASQSAVVADLTFLYKALGSNIFVHNS